MSRWPGEPESVDDHFDTMLAREAKAMDGLIDELERRTRQTTKPRGKRMRGGNKGRSPLSRRRG